MIAVREKGVVGGSEWEGQCLGATEAAYEGARKTHLLGPALELSNNPELS